MFDISLHFYKMDVMQKYNDGIVKWNNNTCEVNNVISKATVECYNTRIVKLQAN